MRAYSIVFELVTSGSGEVVSGMLMPRSMIHEPSGGWLQLAEDAQLARVSEEMRAYVHCSVRAKEVWPLVAVIGGWRRASRSDLAEREDQ